MRKILPTPKAKLITGTHQGIYFTERTQQFLKNHQNIMGLLRNAIRGSNYFKTKQSIETLDAIKKRNIGFEETHTGNYSGSNNYGTFKVEIGSKKWFVKRESGGVEHLKTLVKRFDATRKMINKLGGKMKGFKLRLIEPELIFANSHVPLGEIFLATEFFDAHNVKLVSDILAEAHINPVLSKLALKLTEASGQIESEMGTHVRTGETRILNLFYEQKSNTIWIFDMGGAN